MYYMYDKLCSFLACCFIYCTASLVYVSMNDIEIRKWHCSRISRIIICVSNVYWELKCHVNLIWQSKMSHQKSFLMMKMWKMSYKLIKPFIVSWSSRTFFLYPYTCTCLIIGHLTAILSIPCWSSGVTVNHPRTYNVLRWTRSSHLSCQSWADRTNWQTRQRWHVKASYRSCRKSWKRFEFLSWLFFCYVIYTLVWSSQPKHRKLISIVMKKYIIP